jgi:hypothetical protein
MPALVLTSVLLVTTPAAAAVQPGPIRTTSVAATVPAGMSPATVPAGSSPATVPAGSSAASVGQAPAGVGRDLAETPAERAKAIADALRKDPLYVDPAYASAFPPAARAELRRSAVALGYPVYSIVLPLTPGDHFQGQERRVLTLVIDALRQPGLYVVMDGSDRFPISERFDRTEPDDSTLDTARLRALSEAGYRATPAQVLTRMYELLAMPAAPPTSAAPEQGGATGPTGGGSSDASARYAVVSIAAGLLAALVVLGLGLRHRRRRGAGTGPAWRREKPFTIPPHVAATVAAAQRRRLTTETSAELTRLGTELAALPTVGGEGLRHQQQALDAHQAAGRILDSSQDLVDVVGAMVLLDRARREYDLATALAAGRRPTDVPPLCAFNPLHGRASRRPTPVDADGSTLTLPLCGECRGALKRGTAPASLPGDDGPYWHGRDLWARTFFGALDDDLAGAVSRGEHRS